MTEEQEGIIEYYAGLYGFSRIPKKIRELAEEEYGNMPEYDDPEIFSYRIFLDMNKCRMGMFLPENAENIERLKAWCSWLEKELMHEAKELEQNREFVNAMYEFLDYKGISSEKFRAYLKEWQEEVSGAADEDDWEEMF